MEDNDNLESWENFFSLVFGIVTEILFKRETESLVVADSIQTRLCCCIQSILNLKDYLHLTRVQSFQEGEITMAEEILTVLDHMITNLEQEERYWCMKIERLFNQGGHDDNMPSLIFVQYHFSGLPGRPKFHLDVDQIESLRAMGFSFTNISKMFGISRSTLYRHCADLGIVHRRITDISDQELDVTIIKLKEVLPHVGERVIIGHLRQSGIFVQRERVRQSIHRVDPLNTALRWNFHIIRRTYSVPGPNSLWHIGKHFSTIV